MLQDLLNEQKKLFSPGVHTELRGQKNRNRRVILLSGDVLANVRSDVSGVSARVYRGGVWGFSSMAEYTKEAAEKVLKAAGMTYVAALSVSLVMLIRIFLIRGNRS